MAANELMMTRNQFKPRWEKGRLLESSPVVVAAMEW